MSILIATNGTSYPTDFLTTKYEEMEIEKFLKSKGLYYTRDLINITDETINLPEIMKEYAKLYHESELKKLRVGDVSGAVCDCGNYSVEAYSPCCSLSCWCEKFE